MVRALSSIRMAVVAGLALLFLVQQAGATHQPADKIHVSASIVEVMQAQVGVGASSSPPDTLLSGTFRNSTPTDLIIQVTGECALWTDIVSPELSPALEEPRYVHGSVYHDSCANPRFGG
jgi:hypothetical protein